MCQQYKAEASMIKHNILFIGLDTHKTFTEVAYIENQRGAKPVHLAKFLTIKPPLRKGREAEVFAWDQVSGVAQPPTALA